MIEVMNLSKSYGEDEILSDLSFVIPEGKITGFLGANGAGKTTTLDILTGCIGADAGTVMIDGFNLITESNPAKKRIGYLPDTPPLHPDMTISEFLNYCARLHGVTGAKQAKQVNKTLAKLSLSTHANKTIKTLSKGFKQRVSLAQAIVHDPPILILDEPTDGLDPQQIIQIRELIKRLRGDHTILFSSHILSEVEQICDHVIIIQSGKIVAQGPIGTISSKMDNSKTYELRVHSNAEILARKIQDFPTVSHVQYLDSESAIQFELYRNQEDLTHILQQTIDGGHGIREVIEKSNDLERAFLHLTNKTQEKTD